MKILFKLTTRGRPELAIRCINSIADNINNAFDFHVLMSVDNDDKSYNWPKIMSIEFDWLTIMSGESKSKIDAINRDVNEFDYDWDILVNVSDDHVFIKKGFDEDIRKAFTFVLTTMSGNTIHTNLDRFIHFPDGNRTDICTMSIMGRDYYNRDKRIYYNGYKSICCDDDATAEAKLRGCYKFVNTQISIHDHYQWKDGSVCHRPDKFDATYQMNDLPEVHDHDYALLEYRKSINFGVK